MGRPKIGNDVGDNCDAYWPQRPVRRNERIFRFAVADGASQAAFSNLWAAALVHAYCKGMSHARSVKRTLPRLAAKWATDINKSPLPWYAEEQARAGSYAALVGLTLRSTGVDGEGEWDALAVGDSCLFHIRDNAVLSAFPLASSADFGNRPTLLPTLPLRPHELESSLAVANGTWRKGDEFLLLSDALACWFLLSHERGEQPWRALAGVLESRDPRLFDSFVQGLWESKQLTNDDFTALVATVE